MACSLAVDVVGILLVSVVSREVGDDRGNGAGGCGLHALRGRREVRKDRADAGLKVSTFECFVVDAIVDASDLALNCDEAVVELLDRFGEVVLGHHVLDDVGQHLAEFFECCFLCSHMRGSIPRWRVVHASSTRDAAGDGICKP
jgi:hypothetical protein